MSWNCQLNIHHRTLQNDLMKLETWSANWQLNFNIEKCEVMRITKKTGHTRPSYTLTNKALNVVDETKDLGVNITSKLSWSLHVNQCVNKANRVLGFLKRTVGPKNYQLFSKLYKTLVRPILEYCSPIWSPYLKKDIKALEKVQRRASRCALRNKGGHEISYEERLKILQWPTLEKRRDYLSLVECYKTIHGLNGLDPSINFTFASDFRQLAFLTTDIFASFGLLPLLHLRACTLQDATVYTCSYLYSGNFIISTVKSRYSHCFNCLKLFNEDRQYPKNGRFWP